MSKLIAICLAMIISFLLGYRIGLKVEARRALNEMRVTISFPSDLFFWHDSNGDGACSEGDMPGKWVEVKKPRD